MEASRIRSWTGQDDNQTPFREGGFFYGEKIDRIFIKSYNMNMRITEAQNYRYNLARDLKNLPADQRGERLQNEQLTVDYQMARELWVTRRREEKPMLLPKGYEGLVLNAKNARTWAQYKISMRSALMGETPEQTLHRWYIDREQSVQDIADFYEVSNPTVRATMQKLGIQRRTGQSDLAKRRTSESVKQVWKANRETLKAAIHSPTADKSRHAAMIQYYIDNPDEGRRKMVLARQGKVANEDKK